MMSLPLILGKCRPDRCHLHLVGGRGRSDGVFHSLQPFDFHGLTVRGAMLLRIARFVRIGVRRMDRRRSE